MRAAVTRIARALCLLPLVCACSAADTPAAQPTSGDAGRTDDTAGGGSGSSPSPASTAPPTAISGVDAGEAATTSTDASAADAGALDAGPPTDTCTIQGGAGLPLSGPTTLTQSECQAQCDEQAAAHPNRTCSWGIEDLAPLGSCLIIGGAGANLFGPDSTTEGQCFTECAALAQPHPNRSCTWAGAGGTVNLITGVTTPP